MKYLLVFSIFILGSTVPLGTTVASNRIEKVPLNQFYSIPALDLIGPSGELLTIEDTHRLRAKGVDVSKLNPESTDEFTNVIRDSLRDFGKVVDVEESQEVTYLGQIKSQSESFRFNFKKIGNDSKIFVGMISKRQHTQLLRRNLLYRIGYNLPDSKYLKKITIHFESEDKKRKFIDVDLPRGAFATSERWIVKETDLTVTLQDLVVFLPKEKDHYDASLGVPSRTLRLRELRALNLVYEYLNFGESINRVSFKSGRIEDDSLRLSHFTEAQMNASINDIRWMARRLAKLNRSDIEEIVTEAHFPVPVAKLVIEKLIARKNTLLDKVGIKHKTEYYNEKISMPPYLIDGKLNKEDWAGYASRFSHGQPESPFKDIGYYIFSEFQAETITNLISKLNEKLSLIDINDARREYLQDEFEKGLDHYVETGEFLEREVGTWFSPTVSGSLIMSRKVVIGGQFGTDNLVQLADVFGFTGKVGAHVGFEGLDLGYNLSAKTNLSFLKTYTHLKPLKSLKHIIKEPYQNMIVPLVRYLATKKISNLVDYEKEMLKDREVAKAEQEKIRKEAIKQRKWRSRRGTVMPYAKGDSIPSGYILEFFLESESLGKVQLYKLREDQSEDDFEHVVDWIDGTLITETSRVVKDDDGQEWQIFEKKNRIEVIEEPSEEERVSSLMKYIKDYLGVGESIIINEKVSPEVIVKGGYNFVGQKISVLAMTEFINISRIHIYRKSASQVQIYQDRGYNNRNSFDSEFGFYIPILGIGGKASSGNYGVKIFNLNIESDLKKNPKLFVHAAALEQALGDGDTELAHDIGSPYVIRNEFKDQLNFLSLFFWKSKGLMRSGKLTVITPEGRNDLIKVTDFRQSGTNYRSFTTDIINYYFAKEESKVRFGNDSQKNPGQTIFGSSTTHGGRFEAKIEKNGKISRPFISISYLEEGWKINQKEMQKRLKKYNDKYQMEFFNKEDLFDATSLRLYNLSINLNLYDKAISNLKLINNDSFDKLNTNIYSKAPSSFGCIKRYGPYAKHWKLRDRCFFFKQLKKTNTLCKKLSSEKDNIEIAKCYLDLAKIMEQNLRFDHFLNYIGGRKNIYLYGKITGFRMDSEVIADPIFADSAGNYNNRKDWNGAVEWIRDVILKSQRGEFSGNWIREIL